MAYTDASDPQIYRLLIDDGLDFAFGDDPDGTPTTVTSPVTFNHGTSAIARSAQLFIVAGEAVSTDPDNITVSNNPTVFNALASSDGAKWDSIELPVEHSFRRGHDRRSGELRARRGAA